MPTKVIILQHNLLQWLPMPLPSFMMTLHSLLTVLPVFTSFPRLTSFNPQNPMTGLTLLPWVTAHVCKLKTLVLFPLKLPLQPYIYLVFIITLQPLPTLCQSISFVKIIIVSLFFRHSLFYKGQKHGPLSHQHN